MWRRKKKDISQPNTAHRVKMSRFFKNCFYFFCKCNMPTWPAVAVCRSGIVCTAQVRQAVLFFIALVHNVTRVCTAVTTSYMWTNREITEQLFRWCLFDFLPFTVFPTHKIETHFLCVGYSNQLFGNAFFHFVTHYKLLTCDVTLFLCTLIIQQTHKLLQPHRLS